MYKITTGKYTFWFTGRSIFLKVGMQKMAIVSKDGLGLSPSKYAHITDLAYRRRIVDSDGLYDLMAEYMLVSTQRSLK